MTHVYNEIDGHAATWLENLIRAGEIPDGKVDRRSIKDLDGDALLGVTQFHTFAGIGGWPLALRLAGWPEWREVWTGSCPCQPFSAAGKKGGVKDERHLWPDFFRLISVKRPLTIFGEQVAGKAGLGWLDGVFADLEGIGYACGAAVIGAHSVGAPHIRQRIYWGARRMAQDPDGRGRGRGRDGDTPRDDGQVQATGLRPVGGVANNNNTDEFERAQTVGEAEPTGSSMALRLGDHQGEGRNQPGGHEHGAAGSGEGSRLPASTDETRRLADSDSQRLQRGPVSNGEREEISDVNRGSRLGGLADDDDEGLEDRRQGRPESGRGPVTPWSDFRIVPCTDGKARRTGARVFPLAHGLPRGVGDGGAWRKGLARGASRARVGMLKGSGNAIVPALAAEFIRAFMEVTEGRES